MPYTSRGSLSIGRSSKNGLVLDLPNVSRRHTFINGQDLSEFWLIDFGSSNGTFLNNRRVHHPIQLHDYDQIVIGDTALVFRKPVGLTTFTPLTIRRIEDVSCWLLVADIENFTALTRI